MAKKQRISYGDRLLMGSIGNLQGLRSRLPTFQGYDRDKVQSAITAAGQLINKLESMLGSTSSLDAAEIRSTFEQQSATRSAGQAGRQDACD